MVNLITRMVSMECIQRGAELHKYCAAAQLRFYFAAHFATFACCTRIAAQQQRNRMCNRIKFARLQRKCLAARKMRELKNKLCTIY